MITIAWRYKPADPNISLDYSTIENIKRIEFNLDGSGSFKIYGTDGEMETILLDVPIVTESFEMIDYYSS